MICAVILAAGRSTRMGTQKLLLPYAGRTMIGHVVDQVSGAPVDRIMVVTGADHEAMAAAIGKRDVSFVHNPDPAADMLSSVRCGLRALPQGCDAVLVVLGDQPAVTTQMICSILKSHRPNGHSILVPVYGGRRGHPILIPVAHFSEVLTTHDGIGLRGLLLAHPQDVFEVPVDVPGVIQDIDTPQDYRAASGGGESKIR